MKGGYVVGPICYVTRITRSLGEQKCGTENDKRCARHSGAWRDGKLVAAAVEKPIRRGVPGQAHLAAAGAVSAPVTARKTLGAQIPVAGRRDLGRHHGAWHARGERGRGFATAGLSRRGLEPRPKADRRRPVLPWHGAAQRVPAANRYPG